MSYNGSCWKKYQKESEEYRTNFQSNGLFGDSNTPKYKNNTSNTTNTSYKDYNKPYQYNKPTSNYISRYNGEQNPLEPLADCVIAIIELVKAIFKS